MKTSHILIVLAASLFFLSLTNYVLLNSLHSGQSPGKTENAITPAETNTKEERAEETIKHFPLVPEDPAKYGIVSIPETQLPKDQLGWDVQMKSILVDSKLLETPEGKTAIQQMQTNRKNFTDIMGKVEKELANFENQQKQNPLDKNIENRVQTLYKLKAMGKILEEKVVTLPDPVERASTPQPLPHTTEQNVKNALSGLTPTP